jgi:hypothetical protein
MTTAEQQIREAPQPMIAPHEVVVIAPSAVVAWTNDAQSRDVSLLEHNSALCAGIAMCDYIASPRAWSRERTSILVQPYAAVPYYDPMPAQGAGAGNAAIGWRMIPATGVYARPTEPEAQRWWDAVMAWVWRVADLTTESAQTTASTLPADAAPVAVFGEAAEATVTMVGRKFREHAQTVAASRPLFAGAFAWLEGRAGALTTGAQTTAAAAILRDVEPLRATLAKEREDISKRSSTRALVTLGVVVGGAYAISRM